jgi:DNA-binding NtrC family response regulator
LRIEALSVTDRRTLIYENRIRFECRGVDSTGSRGFRTFNQIGFGYIPLFDAWHADPQLSAEFQKLIHQLFDGREPSAGQYIVNVTFLGQINTVALQHDGGLDVRIITATNKNLEEMIARKEFREDFFFRINVIPIHLPPLRHRAEDIPQLVNAFIRRLQTRTGKNITGLNREAMELFMAYHWPGNVRELKSALEYAFVIAEQGSISPETLPPQLLKRERIKEMESFVADYGDQGEKNALIDALRQSNGNQSKAARILGISRVTVWNRMRKYGIDLKRVMTT